MGSSQETLENLSTRTIVARPPALIADAGNATGLALRRILHHQHLLSAATAL
jgi:hypothetical protein